MEALSFWGREIQKKKLFETYEGRKTLVEPESVRKEREERKECVSVEKRGEREAPLRRPTTEKRNSTRPTIST